MKNLRVRGEPPQSSVSQPEADSAGNDLPVWRTVAHSHAARWAPPRACAVP